MIPVPLPQEPTPQYVWAPPQVTSRIRRICTAVGVVLLVAGPVLGVLTVFLGNRLSTARHVFDSGLVLMSVLAAVFVFICGFGIAGARSYVSEQHVNVAGTAVLRRMLVVFAGGTVFVAGLATLFLLAMANGTDVGFSPGMVAYLVLLACGPVLAVAGTVIAYRLLRPSPAGWSPR